MDVVNHFFREKKKISTNGKWLQSCQEINMKSWTKHTQGSERTLCDRRDRYKILTPCARYNHSKTKAKFQLIVQMVQKNISDSWLMCSIVVRAYVCVCILLWMCVYSVCVVFFCVIYYFFFLPLLSSVYLFIFYTCVISPGSYHTILMCARIIRLEFLFYLVAVYASRKKILCAYIA